MVTQTAPSASIGVTHPLDPLTPDEISAASAIAAAHRPRDGWRFPVGRARGARQARRALVLRRRWHRAPGVRDAFGRGLGRCGGMCGGFGVRNRCPLDAARWTATLPADGGVRPRPRSGAQRSRLASSHEPPWILGRSDQADPDRPMARRKLRHQVGKRTPHSQGHLLPARVRGVEWIWPADRARGRRR